MIGKSGSELNKINSEEFVNTATALGANGKYAGSSFPTIGYTKLVGYAVADQDGRFEIQQSQSDFTADVISEFDLEIAQVAMDYCQVYDDTAATYINETTSINDDTVDDVELLIASGKASIIYFGSYVRFNKQTIVIGIQGNYTGSIAWEYWNGTTWVAVSNLTDGTTNFKAAPGTVTVTYDMPTNWEVNTINGVVKYWLRARSTCTGLVTSPELTQGWNHPLVEIPFSIDVLGKYAKLLYYNKETAQTYFRAITNLRTL